MVILFIKNEALGRKQGKLANANTILVSTRIHAFRVIRIPMDNFDFP